MNRREAFGLAGALLSVGAVPARKKIGCLTVNGHLAHKQLTGEHLLVLLDGVDVTDICLEADDIHGYVLLFCRDRQSHQDWTARDGIHLGGDGGGACRLRLTGHVEFRVKT